MANFPSETRLQAMSIEERAYWLKVWEHRDDRRIAAAEDRLLG